MAQALGGSRLSCCALGPNCHCRQWGECWEGACPTGSAGHHELWGMFVPAYWSGAEVPELAGPLSGLASPSPGVMGDEPGGHRVPLACRTCCLHPTGLAQPCPIPAALGPPGCPQSGAAGGEGCQNLLVVALRARAASPVLPAGTQRVLPAPAGSAGEQGSRLTISLSVSPTEARPRPGPLRHGVRAPQPPGEGLLRPHLL